MRRPFTHRIWGPGGVKLILGDAAVLGLLTIAVIALGVPRTGGNQPTIAEVEVSGRAVATIDLASDGLREVTGPLGVTRIEVRGGRVRVLSSPCPRQSCRHGGWIDKAGGMLVCLPNEVVVRLPGARLDAPDAVSR